MSIVFPKFNREITYQSTVLVICRIVTVLVANIVFLKDVTAETRRVIKKAPYLYDTDKTVTNKNTDSDRILETSTIKEQYIYGAGFGNKPFQHNTIISVDVASNKDPDNTIFFNPSNFKEPTGVARNLNGKKRARSLADFDFNSYVKFEEMKSRLKTQRIGSANRDKLELSFNLGPGAYINYLQSSLPKVTDVSKGILAINPLLTFGLKLYTKLSAETFLELTGNYAMMLPYSYAIFVSPTNIATSEGTIPFVAGNIIESRLLLGFDSSNKIGAAKRNYISGVFGADFVYRNVSPFFSSYFSTSSSTEGMRNGTSGASVTEQIYTRLSGFEQNVLFGITGGIRFNFVQNDYNRSTFNISLATGPGFYFVHDYSKEIPFDSIVVGGYASIIVNFEHQFKIADSVWIMIGIRNRADIMFLVTQGSIDTDSSPLVAAYSSFIYGIVNNTNVYTGILIGF